MHRRDALAQKHKTLQARIAELQSAYAAEAHEIEQSIVQESARQELRRSTRRALAADREASIAARRRTNGGVPR